MDIRQPVAALMCCLVQAEEFRSAMSCSTLRLAHRPPSPKSRCHRGLRNPLQRAERLCSPPLAGERIQPVTAGSVTPHPGFGEAKESALQSGTALGSILERSLGTTGGDGSPADWDPVPSPAGEWRGQQEGDRTAGPRPGRYLHPSGTEAEH